MLKIKKVTPLDTIHEVELYFDSVKETEPIARVNWEKFSYKPDVKFKIAHTGSEIYLQYIVHEKYIRAIHKNDNESVWTDSCVEFFFTPVDDGSYYNIEFNCIGTTLIGFGHGKTNRERAGIEITSQIERNSSLSDMVIKNREGDFSWNLTLVIPATALYKHNIVSFSGMHSKANFYKCGDELKVPHYLSWKPIQFERPNFHLPQFFDELIFEE